MACQVWVGGGLLAASMGCAALSLGPVQGQALMGRSLDVSIPLTFFEGDSVADICANAQVFFADAPVSSAGVKTGVVFSAANKGASVRVQTFAPLAETFARIDLQVGCSQRIMRSYVLLADLAPASAVFSDAGLNKAAAASTAPDQANSHRVVSQASQGAVSSKGALTPVARMATKLVPHTDRATVRTPEPVALAEPQRTARLTLDPVELMAAASQMQPSLRMSVDAPAESVEDADLAQRRQVARVLWKSMNDSPEQLAANLLRAETGEVEVARAHAALNTAKQAEQAAQAKLVQEQRNRYTNPLFLGLLVALIAAVTGMAWLWRRLRQGAAVPRRAPWWKQGSVVDRVEPGFAPPSVPKRGWLPSLKAQSKSLSPHQPTAEPSVNAMNSAQALDPFDAGGHGKSGDFMREAARAAVRQKAAKPVRSHLDFSNTFMPEGAGSVATEELFGLQQQVEFFISLGKSNQAIELLRTHLAESDEANPLAYLDLLRLYHELARRDDYVALQRQFNQKFNGNAPDFEHFHTWLRGLDQYEAALNRIAREVLDGHPSESNPFEDSYFGAGSTTGQTHSGASSEVKLDLNVDTMGKDFHVSRDRVPVLPMVFADAEKYAIKKSGIPV